MAKKFLYVEDNASNARLLEKLLYKYPNILLIAATAKEGLELLEKHDIELLFLDVNLPDIDGVTLIKQLKADDRYKDIPTMAVTANAMYGDREMYLESGFDNYVAKPIMRVELYFVIDQLMKKNSKK